MLCNDNDCVQEVRDIKSSAVVEGLVAFVSRRSGMFGWEMCGVCNAHVLQQLSLSQYHEGSVSADLPRSRPPANDV